MRFDGERLRRQLCTGIHRKQPYSLRRAASISRNMTSRSTAYDVLVLGLGSKISFEPVLADYACG